MRQLANIVSRAPLLVLLVLATVSVFATLQLVDFENRTLRLPLDPSVGELLPHDDPDLLYYQRVRHVFGSEESVVVVVAGDDAFSARHLATIQSISEQLARLPEVQRVLSLTTAVSISADEDGLEFSDGANQDFALPQVRDQLRADIADNPLYRDVLVSRDGTASAVVVNFDRLSDNDFVTRNIPDQVRAIASAHADGQSVWITGSPVIKTAIAEALAASLNRILPAIVIVVAVFLLLAFRSLSAMLLPVLAVTVALLWTLALVSALGRPLTVVTVLVPPLVITLGLAYSMHVISEYRALRTGFGRGRDLAHALVSSVTLPLILSGVTTAVGLAALALNTLPAIREFALFSGIGVLLAVTAVLTLIPAALSMLPPRPASHASDGTLFTAAAERLVRSDRRHRGPILVAGSLLLAVAVFGATQIEIGTSFTGGLRADHRARADFEAINNLFGGANSFYIAIDAPDADTWVQPQQLERLAALQRWLDMQPEVDRTTSLVDHLKLINRSMNEGDPAHYRIPQTVQLAKQLLFFGGGEEIEQYVDTTYRSANVTVQINVDDTRDINRLFVRTAEQLQRFPYPLQARITGNLALVTRTVDDIARGQLLSISVAMVVVWLILSALFTSWRTGALALLPNLLPIAFYFGSLGLLGITLNTTTSLVACIALGIAVDDTVHFMVRFNAEARASGREGTAVQRALCGVIRPVTYTSIIVVFGFLMLTGSELSSQVQFGALAAATVAVAWLVDLTLTPALASGLRIVTLWDLLRLDLGPEPQKSIPVFAGLSVRQARTFALLADLWRYPAGTRIVIEGEQASDEFFVIIDGELSAWIERDGEQVTLSTMCRGTTFGEAGVFAQRRGASVTTLTDARLLRFTTEDLDLLRKRYPRIAALVYSNLNRVQAERAARDLERIRGTSG